jgi:hypothetical protein
MRISRLLQPDRGEEKRKSPPVAGGLSTFDVD